MAIAIVCGIYGSKSTESDGVGLEWMACSRLISFLARSAYDMK